MVYVSSVPQVKVLRAEGLPTNYKSQTANISVKLSLLPSKLPKVTECNVHSMHCTLTVLFTQNTVHCALTTTLINYTLHSLDNVQSLPCLLAILCPYKTVPLLFCTLTKLWTLHFTLYCLHSALDTFFKNYTLHSLDTVHSLDCALTHYNTHSIQPHSLTH